MVFVPSFPSKGRSCSGDSRLWSDEAQKSRRNPLLNNVEDVPFRPLRPRDPLGYGSLLSQMPLQHEKALSPARTSREAVVALSGQNVRRNQPQWCHPKLVGENEGLKAELEDGRRALDEAQAAAEEAQRESAARGAEAGDGRAPVGV